MKEAKSSHQEQGLPMSLINSTANCNADDLDEETGLEIGEDATRNEKGNQCAEVDVTRAIPEFTRKGIQAAIHRLKNGRAGDSERMRAGDIKKSDEATMKCYVKKDCTPEAWRRVRLKVIYERVTWRRLVITAKFVLHRKCTHYFQRSYPSDFTPGLTVDSQLIREGFDDPIKLIIWQRTECWSTDVGSGESKCGSPLLTLRKYSTRSGTTNCGLRSNNSVSNRNTSGS